MTVSYVYFVEDTQEIASIGNVKLEDSNLKYIEVPYEDVRPILTGRERLRDYKVLFDVALGEYIFSAKIDVHEAVSVTWDSSIYQVPLLDFVDNSGDVLIVEDSKLKIWTISVSEKVKSTLAKLSDSHHHMFELYVTRKDDANVLLTTLPIFSLDLVKNGKIIFKDIDFKEPTSVYCKKIFDSYHHVTL